MADRSRKEATPPPLLLMPANGGLTLNPPEQPNVLMPVVQSETAPLFCSDEEAEADSFVGQNVPENSASSASQQATPFNMFQQSNPASVDPFSQVGHNLPSTSQQKTIPKTDAPVMFTSASFPNTPSVPQKPPDPVTTSSVSDRSKPPTMSSFTVGSPETTSTPNRYRQKGPLRYAPPPVETYSPAHPKSYRVQSQVGPPPKVGEMPMYTSTASDPNIFHQNQQMTSVNYQPPVDCNSAFYQPVQAHWCFCKRIENREVWFPFSIVDSIRLETVFQNGCADGEVVATDGGRYDIQVNQRIRKAVYWNEDHTHVRRSTWFYKREGDNKYVPYTEAFAQKLEEEYKNAILNNLWHKKLEFPGGETIVMHNPNVIVHFQTSSQPDEWGTIHSVYSLPGEQMRPRVVKRGIEDFATVYDGETGQIDHLVFIVHGIGPVCDLRFRSIVECVDDFRSISQTLLQSHFSEGIRSGYVGRVEYLPVHWHSALHSEATGIDNQLKAITLPSTQKLRQFINDTLLDILFYTSPKYCQTMCDTVGSEINRLYELFLLRNPTFKGTVSVSGHSLGSSILFDLLLHQHNPQNNQKLGDKSKDVSPEPVPVPEVDKANALEEDTNQETEMNLEDLLAKAGLQDKIEIFKNEQIDIDALSMCTDEDLKCLGLPMGPRKKLQKLMMELKQHQEEAAMKQKIEAENKRKEEEKLKEAETNLKTKLLKCETSISVDYLMGVAGTGQPFVEYPQLLFHPVSFFALGSPIGVFLAVRGVEKVGEEFCLPTCSRVFNIFHPFDSVAYRIEPLVNAQASNHKPVLIPHHKGRKRLHLELRESLSRVGSDLKQRFLDSLKSTWNSINEFARAHTSNQTLEQHVEKEMSEVINQLVVTDDESCETASIASSHDEEISMGLLNEGRRIDYVLQEKPIESFNDYLFALTSHGCYWESEDTVLLILKELYSIIGIYPQTNWPDSMNRSTVSPPSSTVPLTSPSTPLQTPSYSDPQLNSKRRDYSSPVSSQATANTSHHFGVFSPMGPPTGPPPKGHPSVGPPPMGPPPTGPPSMRPSVGPPPMGPPSTGPSLMGPPSTGPPPMGPPSTGPSPMGPPSTGPPPMRPSTSLPPMGPPSTGPPPMGPPSVGPPPMGPPSTSTPSIAPPTTAPVLSHIPMSLPSTNLPPPMGPPSTAPSMIPPTTGPQTAGMPVGPPPLTGFIKNTY